MPQTKPMSVAEFLAWERGQELRHEFDGDRTTAMTGGTLNHSCPTTKAAVTLPGLSRRREAARRGECALSGRGSDVRTG
jgi:hypothetical protein